jgi:hypothetical protein
MPDNEYSADRCREHREIIDDTVERTQTLVDEYHQMRVDAAKINGELAMLCQRIPKDLTERLVALETKLDSLVKSTDTVRNQVYAFAFLIMAGFVTALWAILTGKVAR